MCSSDLSRTESIFDTAKNDLTKAIFAAVVVLSKYSDTLNHEMLQFSPEECKGRAWSSRLNVVLKVVYMEDGVVIDTGRLSGMEPIPAT